MSFDCQILMIIIYHLNKERVLPFPCFLETLYIKKFEHKIKRRMLCFKTSPPSCQCTAYSAGYRWSLKRSTSSTSLAIYVWITRASAVSNSNIFCITRNILKILISGMHRLSPRPQIGTMVQGGIIAFFDHVGT